MLNRHLLLTLLPLLTLCSACQQLLPTRANPTVNFLCKNDTALQVKFNNQQQYAEIHYQGETIQLAQQPSASGFYYANAQQQLRGKGKSLTLQLNPAQQIQCVAYP
ncbi:MliC family protein [Shewanella avicenniae]|uniref:MliC family protein n=1 Tax=Shewanella avicenniae TaxID=2814294 RepID=A0ABX7QPZ2_9GAMM|nr:MliC family protein [Shewanella avicenniae]QSX33543.1 MliC family protein [Shewanella avicenniae]